MSTTVKVVSTDLRQVAIKVTPSTYLTDVLEQACKKFSLSPDKYLLKHKEKELDLSNNFRNAGLIAGAKLELIAKSKSPAVLNIALQLPEPEARQLGAPRATAKLPSDYTIWKVLRHFESVVCNGKGVNITGRGVPRTDSGGSSGQLYYETPTLQVESRVLSNFVDFQKTMSQLGYNKGNVLIRLSFQKTDKTFVDATNDISEYFEDEEAARQQREAAKAEDKPDAPTSKAVDPASTAPEPQQESTSAANESSTTATDATSTTETKPEPMEVDSTPLDPLAPVSIFSPPKNSTPAAAHTIESDEIYVPGIAHAQLHQQRLKTEGQNKRLLSDREIAEKEAERAARLAAVKAIDIRVRFPGAEQANWHVTPDWTGAMLHRAVRGVMANPEAPFKLLLRDANNKTLVIADADTLTLIRGLNLTRDTLVNFAWDDAAPADVRRQPCLQQAVRARATDVVIPEVPQGEDEDEDGDAKAGPARGAKPSSSSRNEDSEGKKKGIPRWLKLGKK